MGRRQTFAEALARRVERRGPDECWPWIGPSVKGYGQVTGGRVRKYAHHATLELALGRPLRPGYMACHHCDNPRCCNPAHIYEGTAQTNHDDMVARGRQRGGVELGGNRPDVTRRWVADLRDRGGEAASVTSDEYAGWMAQQNADTTAEVQRFVARVEAGEGIDMDTHWADPVMSFVPGNLVELDWPFASWSAA